MKPTAEPLEAFTETARNKTKRKILSSKGGGGGFRINLNDCHGDRYKLHGVEQGPNIGYGHVAHETLKKGRLLGRDVFKREDTREGDRHDTVGSAGLRRGRHLDVR